MPFKNKYANRQKTDMKIMSSNKLISASANSTINKRANMASEKLHHADFVHNRLIIMAITQNHGDGQKSQHTRKIMVFTVTVIFFQPYG